MAVVFISIDRDTPYIFPPSVQDYLPCDHLACIERERAAFEAKQAKHEAREKETGKTSTPPTTGPQAKDPVNLTEKESRIIPTSGGGFEQAYNA